MRQIIVDFGTLHIGSWSLPLRIYGYGLMLVLGFLVAIALAQWRARRVGENPDVIAHVGLLAVVGGILGARLAFVIQDWNKTFAQHPEDILNITSGGLIYYGGLILAALMVIAYLAVKRLPVRRYLDIVAVSIMVGLAFGRAGCLLNGCCYGGTCSASSPIGIKFPMYSRPLLKLDGTPGPFSANTEAPSPVYAEQFRGDAIHKGGIVHPDGRLMFLFNDYLLPVRDLHGPLANDQAGVMFGTREEAKAKFDALAMPSGKLNEEKWQKAIAGGGDGLLRGSELWEDAVRVHTSRMAEMSKAGADPAEAIDDGRLSFDDYWSYLMKRRAILTVRLGLDGADTPANREAMNKYLQADLYALASDQYSNPVKASQAIGIANALLLAVLLGLFFRLRTREGQVFAVLMLLYPMTRFVEELIRADNKHSLLEGVLTHNQYTSMALFVAGVIMLLTLRKLPASAGPTWSQRLAAAVSPASGSTSDGRKPKKNHAAHNGQRS